MNWISDTLPLEADGRPITWATLQVLDFQQMDELTAQRSPGYDVASATIDQVLRRTHRFSYLTQPEGMEQAPVQRGEYLFLVEVGENIRTLELVMDAIEPGALQPDEFRVYLMERLS